MSGHIFDPPGPSAGSHHVGDDVVGMEKLQCLAENRADWHMDCYASYNIPYTDDVRRHARGRVVVCCIVNCVSCVCVGVILSCLCLCRV